MPSAVVSFKIKTPSLPLPKITVTEKPKTQPKPTSPPEVLKIAITPLLQETKNEKTK